MTLSLPIYTQQYTCYAIVGTYQGEEHGVRASTTGAVGVGKPELGHVLHVRRGLAVHTAREHAATKKKKKKIDDDANTQQKRANKAKKKKLRKTPQGRRTNHT